MTTQQQATAMPTSRLTWRRWFAEVVVGVGARPMRVALTLVGTVLGIATLVAVLGLTTSAQGQISERFTELRATGIEVNPVEGAAAGTPFTLEAKDRVARINGVEHAGYAWRVPVTEARAVGKTPLRGQLGPQPDAVEVVAISDGLLEASRATMGWGRTFDRFCLQRACNVAVVGSVAARQLGINGAQEDVHVFIEGQPFAVIGIVADVKRNTTMMASVMIPTTTAQQLWGPPMQDPGWMTLDVRVGAASVVGQQVPYALRPEAMDSLKVSTPPDPRQLQERVGGDLGALFLGLAGITLLVGAFGIANSTTVSVMERVPEVGLRRALGARPVHIAAQFVGESSVLGLIGGLIGTPVGIGVVVAVCAIRQWTAVMPSWLLVTPLVGLFTGLIAGIYPAMRAARVEPVTALQR
ncbi:ABC transporter permease [uncultured Tessaracoccus sp.]|uniref:ABC transporter permease n=1 Tax=uncultured Tessaracoccus sp. TaxID=905023 RepID=UPI002607A82C|nr:ABC transporter permease [uncultured Tessaracoccus sp.]